MEMISGLTYDDPMGARLDAFGQWISTGPGDDTILGAGELIEVRVDDLRIAEDHLGRLTFLGEAADCRNGLGLYRIGADGSISDVTILVAKVTAQGPGGDPMPGEPSVDIPLRAGDRIGFFILPNGYEHSARHLLGDTAGRFEFRNTAGEAGNIGNEGNLTLWHIAPDGTRTAISTGDGHDTFHSAAQPENDHALHSDNLAHSSGEVDPDGGSLWLGFEGLHRGGDRDCGNVVLHLDLGWSNARALDPLLVSDLDGVAGHAPGNRPGPDDALLNEGSIADALSANAGKDLLEGQAGDQSAAGRSRNR
jgi:hypothetical protein